MLARVIHLASSRARKPWRSISSYLMQEQLADPTIDEALFGREVPPSDPQASIPLRRVRAGARHPADAGLLEICSGGTLTLHASEDLTASAQLKLLRFLDTGEFIREGGQRALRADVRMITVAHNSLLDKAREGHFSQELLKRLAGTTIRVPALRKRKKDIPLLARKFMRDLAAIYRRRVTDISDVTMSVLLAYDWPDNVHELALTIAKAVHGAKGTTIWIDDLDKKNFRDIRQMGNAKSSSADQPAKESSSEQTSTRASVGLVNSRPVASTPPLHTVATVNTENAVVIDGHQVDLSFTQYNVIKALMEANKHSLGKNNFVHKSGHSDAVNVLKRLASRPEWKGIIVLPGKSGRQYRLRVR